MQHHWGGAVDVVVDAPHHCHKVLEVVLVNDLDVRHVDKIQLLQQCGVALLGGRQLHVDLPGQGRNAAGNHGVHGLSQRVDGAGDAERLFNFAREACAQVGPLALVDAGQMGLKERLLCRRQVLEPGATLLDVHGFDFIAVRVEHNVAVVPRLHGWLKVILQTLDAVDLGQGKIYKVVNDNGILAPGGPHFAQDLIQHLRFKVATLVHLVAVENGDDYGVVLSQNLVQHPLGLFVMWLVFVDQADGVQNIQIGDILRSDFHVEILVGKAVAQVLHVVSNAGADFVDRHVHAIHAAVGRSGAEHVQHRAAGAYPAATETHGVLENGVDQQRLAAGLCGSQHQHGRLHFAANAWVLHQLLDTHERAFGKVVQPPSSRNGQQKHDSQFDVHGVVEGGNTGKMRAWRQT